METKKSAGNQGWAFMSIILNSAFTFFILTPDS